MFHGLDQIDWSKFRYHLGIGTEGKDLPRYIRQLLSDDRDKRDYAIQALFGFEQHSGMVGKATPHILPFVFEVLTLDDYPAKSFLLSRLTSLGREIVRTQRNIAFIRDALKAYDVFVTGINIYLKLLNDEDEETRFFAAKLLRYLQDHALEALDGLMHRFEIETMVRIRVTIIRSMAQLLSDIDLMYNYSHAVVIVYLKFIASQITGGVDFTERVAAADSIRMMGYENLMDQDLKPALQAVINEYILLNLPELDDSTDPRDFDPWTDAY